MDKAELLRQYPELKDQIDASPDLVTTGNVVTDKGTQFLQVTQVSDMEGGQFLFELQADGKLQNVGADNVFTPQTFESLGTEAAPMSGVCSRSSDSDHAKVHTASKAAVNQFSSATGPDGGNLACVWAVRNLVHNALNRWITRTDGTAVFAPELSQCFGAPLDEGRVPAGGIVISPTSGSNIGHVGILGDATGDGSRLIYSNSSAAAVWKQNFTLQSWRSRYVDTKHLNMMFFPLPFRTSSQPVA